MSEFYPQKITERLRKPKCRGSIDGANGVGTDASFVCGCYVRSYLRIDPESKKIEAAGFRTNGCGFMAAAADVIAADAAGRNLADLHGSDSAEVRENVEAELGEFPDGRGHCLEVPIAAFHAALADHRALMIEEFRGERALICTCFGVSEDTIEAVIAGGRAHSVEDVTRLCRAGGGCGSCRMLIQEMLDQHVE